MPRIDVVPAGDSYRVVVDEDGSSSTHDVTVGDDLVGQLGVSPEELVKASFRFLLDRESKESIMRTFDLSVIRRYFPEYESKIGEYL